MKMSNLRAFTVMEFTVAMIITSVIIGMGYQAWGLLSRQSGKLEMKEQNILSVTAVDYLVSRDMLESNVIEYMTDEIICHHKSKDIVYAFQPEIIIRHEVISDTFRLKTCNLEKFNNGMPVDDGIIDQLHITVDLGDFKIPLTYKKDYGVAERLSILEKQ